MNIQSGINQTISLASMLMTQSPHIKTREEGKALQARGIAAQKGLEDIYANYKKLEAGERLPYSSTEIEDIKERVPKLNQEIYNAVIAKEDPRLSKYINKSAFDPRPTRSKILTELEGLDKVNEARMRALNKSQEVQESRKASKEFINKVLEGVYTPSQDPRKIGD